MVCPDCEQLAKLVIILQQEIVELKRRLTVYENAHTPPSQKHFIKQTQPTPEAEHDSKPSGRANGHEGVGRTTPKEIHERKTLEPVKQCPDCGKQLTIKRVRPRVVTRLVPGHVENVEYLIPEGYCNHCKKSVEPTVPNALPNARFDVTLATWIACLRMLGMSVDKIRFLLKTDYGVHVSSATIVNSCEKLAEFLGEDYELLRQDLLREKQVHADETSWPVNGKNSWLWEFISHRTAYFTVRPSRKHDVPEDVLAGFKGVLSCDFWNSYNGLECEKQRCWVHLTREFDFVNRYRPSVEFAEFSSQLLITYYWAKAQQRFGHVIRETAEARVHEITSQDYKNKDVLRLVKRLNRHETELFTFAAHKGVETHNNHAEQGIRPAVVVRKTSFGSQSSEGAQDTAVLMSFFQTSRLRNENFLSYLRGLVNNRLQN